MSKLGEHSVTFCTGHIQLWAIVPTALSRFLCALLTLFLPTIKTALPKTEKQSINSFLHGVHQVKMGYIVTTLSLLLMSALSGSFTFLFPLLAAKFSFTGDTVFPLLLGATTVFAGVLHRNTTLRNLALHHERNTVTYCLIGAGISFIALYYSMNTNGAGALLLLLSAIVALTLCNVLLISVQWEYTYKIRSQETTRMYETTDSTIQTCIGLLLPSGMSFLLGICSLNIFWIISLVFIGAAFAQRIYRRIEA